MFLYFFTVILSIVLIIGFHHGFQYVRDTYTVKKVKEVGKYQNEKYEKILRELADRPTSTAMVPYEAVPYEAVPYAPVPYAQEQNLTETDATHLNMDLDDFIKSIDVNT